MIGLPFRLLVALLRFLVNATFWLFVMVLGLAGLSSSFS